MATILRDGRVVSHRGRCLGNAEDGPCGTEFTSLYVAKRHAERLGHTVQWDVVHRRTIVPDTPDPKVN